MTRGTCAHCGRSSSQLRGQRCHTCYSYRLRNGYDRDDELVARAARRHEQPNERRYTNDLVTIDSDANYQVKYNAVVRETPSCDEINCDRPRYDDGPLCKYHSDIAWYRSQRTDTVVATIVVTDETTHHDGRLTVAC